MIYMGIDPGKHGAYAEIRNGQAKAWPWDDRRFAEHMATLSKEADFVMCCLEKVGARPGQGVSSMFSFGESYGFIQGVLTAYGIPFQLVTPAKWKNEFGIWNKGKEGSIEVCKRLFPHVSLLPTERSRKPSDGLSDALCLAEFARRHM